MGILEAIHTMWQQAAASPASSAGIILNLIIIESLLSVDNAAVLATMVKDLPKEQQGKALKYGIWGAYLFRGLAMAFAWVLIKIWWLKPVGGLYLIYLALNWYWSNKNKQELTEQIPDKQKSWLYKNSIGIFGKFWTTIMLVEVMDMAFSIDNVFAAVAFTPNLLLVCIGVFIGIIAMRYIAQWFVQLMHKYPFLEQNAFIVIALLGIKLTLGIAEHLLPNSSLSKLLSSQILEVGITILTLLIFALPVLTSLLFKKTKSE
jgi:YkoY family integral membrane protein